MRGRKFFVQYRKTLDVYVQLMTRRKYKEEHNQLRASGRVKADGIWKNCNHSSGLPAIELTIMDGSSKGRLQGRSWAEGIGGCEVKLTSTILQATNGIHKMTTLYIICCLYVCCCCPYPNVGAWSSWLLQTFQIDYFLNHDVDWHLK